MSQGSIGAIGGGLLSCAVFGADTYACPDATCRFDGGTC